MIFDRNGFQGKEYAQVRNHYLARRLVTTEGWSGSEVPRGKIAQWFGETAFGHGLNELSEGLFFIGRLVGSWKVLKDELKLDPSRHYVKIQPAEGCRFPRKLFRMPGFKELTNGYSHQVVPKNAAGIGA